MRIELKDAFIDGWIEEGLKKGLQEGHAQGLQEGREQGLQEGREEGREQGRAEMLLELLEMRFSVAASIRQRIEACNDTAQIKTWFNRAVTASALDEVFAG